jgi:hypothetical protein
VVELTPSQQRRRAAAETLIRLAEPGLNLILAAGDRISRLVEPEDHEYYPARPFVEREPDGAVRGAEPVKKRSDGGPAKGRSGAKSATRSATKRPAKSRSTTASIRRQPPGETPQP